MKILTFLIIACIIFLVMPVKSQNKIDAITHESKQLQQFKEELTSTVDNFELSKNMNELVAASNRLVLIAKKYNDQWAANYYACYSLTVVSFIEKDSKKKDALLDEAEVYLNKAKNDYKTEYDELYVLNAMVDNARLTAEPATRFKKYGDLFNKNIEKAKSLHPNNPRIYYLKGSNIYYTPKVFGGGAKNALTYFVKAEPIFNNESEDNIFKPYWGERQNTQMLEKCRKELK